MVTIQIKFDELDSLPQGWDWIPLDALMIEPKSDIVDGPFGSNLKASEYKDEGIAIARLQNIDRNRFLFKNIRFISPNKAIELERHNFRPGDILITKLGAPLGKACIAPQQIPQGVIVADLVRVRIRNDHINRAYLSYAINSPFLIKQFEKHIKGTTRPRVNLGVIRKLPIPVAPRIEQNRIVAEIEKQFSRLDEAVENLKRVKANLKRYKASILKNAVEGKLTELWRDEHSDVEPASKLLDRILTERRKKWEEAELAKMKAKGKVPKDDKWKKRYKKALVPNFKDLPEIPKTWTWATPDQLAAPSAHSLAIGPFGSNLKVSDYRETGVPLVFVKNIRTVNFDKETNKYVSVDKAKQLKAHEVQGGDILITKMGDPPGDACIYPMGRPNAIITADCIKWTLSSLLSSAGFFVNTINSQMVKEQILNITKGVAQLKVSLSRFKGIAIPLPPEKEQIEILNNVERKLTNALELERQTDRNLVSEGSLRQSILKKAFSGNLLPQDPRDEPAKKLLDRIKSEREKHKEEHKGKRIKTMKAPIKFKGKRDILAILRESTAPMRPEDLFRMAGYKPEQVEEFYDDLKMVDQKKAVIQEKKKNGEVYLRAV